MNKLNYKNKPIFFSKHSLEQCIERGTNENEVKRAIMEGIHKPAMRNRKICYMNFPFEKKWQNKYYAIKQVAPVIKEEEDKIIVITVYTYYF